MIEQRRSERKVPTSVIKAHDVIMGEDIGQLGNISPEGLMIISDQPIAEGSLFQLTFRLGDADSTAMQFSIGASSLWCVESASGSYWSGFQIVDISDQQDEALRQLHSMM